MCPRGGSKGGCDFADTPQNLPTKYRAWQRRTATDRRKTRQWNKHPLPYFNARNGANLKAIQGKEKAGATYPCGKIKIS